MKTDVIVIGAGPAGATAALYLKRAGLSVRVFDSGGSALLKADRIENYYGTGTVSGRELFEKGISCLEELGVGVVHSQVLSVTYDGSFEIQSDSGIYSSAAVLIASGASRQKPPVEGFDGYLGRGASYCAVCDGFFFRKKAVAVIGSGDYALHEASVLSKICKSVVILTNGEPVTADFSGFDLRTEKITGIEGRDRISAVITEGGALAVDGLFAAVGIAGAADFARRIGAQMNGNDIAVNERFETNVPGLFAAGDCVCSIKQIGTAVGSATAAAMQIIKYVRSK